MQTSAKLPQLADEVSNTLGEVKSETGSFIYHRKASQDGGLSKGEYLRNYEVEHCRSPKIFYKD